MVKIDGNEKETVILSRLLVLVKNCTPKVARQRYEQLDITL